MTKSCFSRIPAFSRKASLPYTKHGSQCLLHPVPSPCLRYSKQGMWYPRGCYPSTGSWAPPQLNSTTKGCSNHCVWKSTSVQDKDRIFILNSFRWYPWLGAQNAYTWMHIHACVGYVCMFKKYSGESMRRRGRNCDWYVKWNKNSFLKTGKK